MPELPEVETIVRDLRPLLTGRTITGVRRSAYRLRKRWNPDWNPVIVGFRIDALRRRGKWIVVELSGRPGHDPNGVVRDPRLVLHLGMTGQLTTASAADPEPDHLHLVFALDDGRELRFRDQRRFGSAGFFPTAAFADAFFTLQQLGPEPFGMDADTFGAAVRKSARTLKALLLDQTVVAGVGNIYADEALFRARLHPGRKGSSLKPAECDALREALEAVLTRAIETRGSTIRDYIGGSGQKGGFQAEHAVYGRTGEPCRACGSAIECVRLAGRASHHCPQCQKSSPQRHKVRTKSHKGK